MAGNRGSDRMINVTKPFLPPLEEVLPALEKIWESRELTNNGSFEKQLEEELGKYLGVKHVSLVSNGTIGLILALKAADVKGKVITTPYSFAATSNVLRWCNLDPVFVDVKSSDLNIDPSEVELAITNNTGAILAVHCYGNPCDVKELSRLSSKYKIPVIYDACHAFGVRHNGKSLLNNGDFSVVSFHATKVFNTFEGGAVISRTKAAKEKIDRLKNFGFQDEITVLHIGINGKMSEFNAAVGLAQIEHLPEVFRKRKLIDERYRECLSQFDGIRCLPQFANGVKNYPYFPILINRKSKSTRDEIVSAMRGQGVNVRRYFYPLITEFESYGPYKLSTRISCPNAFSASMNVICLPIYPDLSIEELEFIIKTLIKFS